MGELSQPNLSSRNKEDHRLHIIERLRVRASIQAVFQEHGQHRAMRDHGKRLMEDIATRDEMMEAMCTKPFDSVKAEAVLEKMKISVKTAPEMLKLRIEILPLILGGTISDYLQSTGELKRK